MHQFQSTPDLVNREKLAVKSYWERSEFQSTPDLVNREKETLLEVGLLPDLFQSTPDLVNREK